MLTLTTGNLLEAEVDALVNPVNCVGVMGKGLAKQFRKSYPGNYEAYKAGCEAGEVQPGKMFVYDLQSLLPPRYIINFPTKRHWKARSRLEDIQTGLSDLVTQVAEHRIKSLALPALGCGLGGLNWDQVYPLIESAFAARPQVEVKLYPPRGAS